MRAIAVALVVAMAGCEAPPKPEPPWKVVVEKIQTVEQRLSWDPFDRNAVRTRATTVFYLVAEDGTMLEVEIKAYAGVKVGDMARGWWK